ncbi:Sensor protein ZraS [Fundidesulfovibrio magnetotacticus]|uniref:histidine kinase n=1 Tax=Fundidesulfovibrio magnetotacticus TaxID=2730080 RepID=A0A6V8LZY8_9BACT|nr:ATP-binding protein [Fundidesulfovibrio magnetotacticus]GFK93795.1 Sensor protein ZraS [Fundidesulfovibrio magnetotacticus]
MRLHVSLRLRIYLVLGLLLAVTVGGGAFMLWYGTRIQTFLSGVFDRQVHALDAAMRLESSLAAQRGFLTYYSLDFDKSWLTRLSEQQSAFERELSKVRSFVDDESTRRLVNDIESGFLRLTVERERVVELLNAGNRQGASQIHAAARKRFDALITQCELFLDSLRAGLSRDRAEGLSRMELANTMATVFVPFTLLLGLVLALVLSRQILGPIRRLAEGEDQPAGPDEVAALETRMHGLLERAVQARSKLEKSQATLKAAERMATVGKMAAGVAHSIRNPLTSVKMRLFSLQRSLDLSENQREDFEVISQEIKHLDLIIQNFLEYARPPKLTLARSSPSDVTAAAVQLMRPRLDAQRITVHVEREEPLRPILIDPEQLKEVLVNLFANAMDAMQGPGTITVDESEGFMEPMGRVAVLSVSDTGPGVPEEERERVFEPFHTTKEEGTGLGLPIARRIVTEHGGSISLTQAKGGGAKFTITLPFDSESQGRARWN